MPGTGTRRPSFRPEPRNTRQVFYQRGGRRDICARQTHQPNGALPRRGTSPVVGVVERAAISSDQDQRAVAPEEWSDRKIAKQPLSERRIRVLLLEVGCPARRRPQPEDPTAEAARCNRRFGPALPCRRSTTPRREPMAETAAPETAIHDRAMPSEAAGAARRSQFVQRDWSLRVHNSLHRPITP